MGGSTKTTSHATTSTTPQVPNWVQTPYQNFYGGVNAMSRNPTDYVTPATANQNQAFARAGQSDPGMAAMQNLTGWQGQQVNPATIAGTDLSPYMNPFQQSVIDSTLAQFGQGNAIGLNQLRASTPTGAFNGSRQGVAEGQLTSDNVRSLAQTLASLNAANFGQAQSAAGQDAASRNQVGIANQGAAQSAAALRLGAAGAASDANRAGIAQQAELGGQERQINNQNNPAIANLSLQQAIQSLLGQNPAMYVGSKGTADQTTKQKTNPGALDILSAITQAVGAMSGGGGNPFKI